MCFIGFLGRLAPGGKMLGDAALSMQSAETLCTVEEHCLLLALLLLVH